MSTYFGVTDTGDGVDSSNSGLTTFNYAASVGSYSFVCPGSGNQTLDSLEAYVRSTSGATVYARLAIYAGAGASRGNLVAQGATDISVSSTDYAWRSTTSFKDKDGNALASVTLTGGSTYTLAMSWSGSALASGRVAVTSGEGKYLSGNYTAANSANFPETLADGNNLTLIYTVRAGVTSASSSAAIPVFLNLQRQLRQ